MIRLLSSRRATPTGSLSTVMELAVAEGAPEPSWVAVEDDEGAWVRMVGGAPAGERARGVVAVSGEEALVTSARLGVGGAMVMPPSLAGAVVAFEAAGNPPPVRPHPDAWLADLVAAIDEEFVAVTWANRPFWRCQLGEPVMASVLAALADALGVLPALLPWPALLVRPEQVGDVASAWSEVTNRLGVASEGVEVVACDRRAGHCGVVTAAMRSLAAAAREGSGGSAVDWRFPKPVHELPSGRRVGWWSPRDVDFEPEEREWLAVPTELSQAGFRWRLTDSEVADRWVDDAFEVTGAPIAAVRIPGWIAGELLPGRPAALLIERLATVAHRLAVPLWVPNVRQESLQFVLRLPGEIWIDGPAVPGES